jgi:acyl carrier protein
VDDRELVRCQSIEVCQRELMHAGPDNDTPAAASTNPGGARQRDSGEQSHGSADDNDLQARLIEILQRISGADAEQITAEARLIEDIGIDSLGFYEILIEADECLGIRIAEEDLLRFRTVGDVQQHLESLKRVHDQND